jgi:hypothetical protein
MNPPMGENCDSFCIIFVIFENGTTEREKERERKTEKERERERER